MLTAINILETVEHVIDGTVFVIKVLKKKDKLKFAKFFSNASKENLNPEMIDGMSEVLKAGLKEIKNIKIGDKVVDLQEIPHEIVDMLTDKVLEELFERIMKFNTAQEPEIKN